MRRPVAAVCRAGRRGAPLAPCPKAVIHRHSQASCVMQRRLELSTTDPTLVPKLMSPRSSLRPPHVLRVLRDQLRDCVTTQPDVGTAPRTPTDIASALTCTFLPVPPPRLLLRDEEVAGS